MSTAIEEQSERQEWLTERKNYLGASDLAAVMGVDLYRTPLDVFNEKLGFVEPFEGNKHTERGTKLEEIAAREYAEKTGKNLRRKNMALVHPKYEFLRGHVDRLVEGKNRIAEIKCPSVGSFARIQREGVPDSWIVQLQAYLMLSGKPAGEYIVFNADKWELLNFELVADIEMQVTIVDVSVRFWREHIETGTPPRTSELDKPKLEFAKVGGDVLQISDPEFIEAAQLLQEAKQLELDGKELYDIAKQRIVKMVGGFGKFQGGNLRLSYYESAGHTSFDKKHLAAEHPEIDLSRYEKRGAPFPVFKPHFIQPKD